jgi:glutamate/tyrosine decarboxylase-like PLP-dependent enzyme
MEHKEILTPLFTAIQHYLDAERQSGTPVVNFKTPAELSRIMDFEVGEEGVNADDFRDMMRQYLEYSVRTGNKQFMNQLYAGFNLPAFAGDVLTILANTSMYTYEVAPVATMIEKEMISLMTGYAGYSNGDGVFLTGGSNANLIALFSARNRKLPASRFDGLQQRVQLKAFVSEHAHYSFENAANMIGIGAHNVVKIAADDKGRMDVEALEDAVQQSLAEGYVPFFVGATCATTVLGAFDPLDRIAVLCHKYDLWLHADGAFGGSLILSPETRHLFNGIEQTDSFGWNPHKLMNIPLVSSVLLVKKKGTLHFNLTDINTDYIFHNNNDTEDLGKKSVQCGRRVDAVKLWFAWKFYGKKGYEERMENLWSLASYAEQFVQNHRDLQLLAPRQSLTVCFRYNTSRIKDLKAFNFEVRERLRKSGKSIVNIAWLGETLTIRLIMANADTQKQDVDEFFHNFLDCAASYKKEITSLKVPEEEKSLV